MKTVVVSIPIKENEKQQWITKFPNYRFLFCKQEELKNHIRRLREKVELNPRDAQIIKTVWGVGYKIEK